MRVADGAVAARGGGCGDRTGPDACVVAERRLISPRSAVRAHAGEPVQEPHVDPPISQPFVMVRDFVSARHTVAGLLGAGASAIRARHMHGTSNCSVTVWPAQSHTLLSSNATRKPKLLPSISNLKKKSKKPRISFSLNCQAFQALGGFGMCWKALEGFWMRFMFLEVF